MKWCIESDANTAAMMAASNMEEWICDKAGERAAARGSFMDDGTPLITLADVEAVAATLLPLAPEPPKKKVITSERESSLKTACELLNDVRFEFSEEQEFDAAMNARQAKDAIQRLLAGKPAAPH